MVITSPSSVRHRSGGRAGEEYFAFLVWLSWSLVSLLAARLQFSLPRQNAIQGMVFGFIGLAFVSFLTKNKLAPLKNMRMALPLLAMPFCALLSDSLGGVGKEAILIGPILFMGIYSQNRLALLKLIENASLLILIFGLILIKIDSVAVNLGQTRYAFSLFNERFSGLANHPNLIATFALIAMFLNSLKSDRSRFFRNSNLLACALTIFLSESRTVWLSLSVGVVIYGYFRIQNSSRGTMWIAVTLITLFSALIVREFWAPLISNTPLGEKATLNGRTQIWSYILDNWHQHPFFGFGSGIWTDLAGTVVPIWAVHGHNQILEELFVRGLVGTFAFLIAYSFIMKISWKARRHEPELLSIASALILISITRPILFEDRFDVDSIAYVWICIRIANYLAMSVKLSD